MNNIREQVNSYNHARSLESINYKLAIVLLIIIIGIGSNAIRTWADLQGDKRQQRIEYLDSRVRELESKLEACESGTPMPSIKDM